MPQPPTRESPIPPPPERWVEPSVARRYAGERWRDRCRRERDPARIERLLRRHGVEGARHRILDVACGAGRLGAMLGRHAELLVGLDVSAAMLAQAARPGPTPPCQRAFLRADAGRLPFRAASFDAVVCCRLLHHLDDDRVFLRTVDELVRVSARLVVASYWDAATLAEWAPRRRRRPRGRSARAKAFVRAAFARAGADVVGFHHALRFVARQSYVVAERRP